MSAILIVVIVIIVVACLGAAYWVTHSKRQLRESFGPEYDQIVQERGSTREADRELQRRKHEHAKLELKPLTEQDRESFLASWEHLQASFIDDPAFSMNSAEQLVSQALVARGYPGGDREEQLALLSVDYSGRLTDYRAAQGVKRRIEAGAGNAAVADPDTDPAAADRDLDTDAALADGTAPVDPTMSTPAPAAATNVAADGPVSTEDIRQALLSYRALFDELVAAPGTEVTRPGTVTTEPVPAQAWDTDTRRDESIEQKVDQ